jgi:hypothetical protein
MGPAILRDPNAWVGRRACRRSITLTEWARKGAVRADAEVAELPGLEHWWMLEDPASGAAVLEEFWRRFADHE